MAKNDQKSTKNGHFWPFFDNFWKQKISFLQKNFQNWKKVKKCQKMAKNDKFLSIFGNFLTIFYNFLQFFENLFFNLKFFIFTSFLTYFLTHFWGHFWGHFWHQIWGHFDPQNWGQKWPQKWPKNRQNYSKKKSWIFYKISYSQNWKKYFKIPSLKSEKCQNLPLSHKIYIYVFIISRC